MYKRRRHRTSEKIQKPKIVYSEDHLGYLIFTPYDKTFVDEIKFLPDSPVRFERDLKAWIIFPDDLDCVKELVSRYFGEFDFLGPSESNSQYGSLPSTNAVSDSDFKTIFRIAGPELSNKFYRMIASNVHPRTESDDHHLSAELNAAWTNIKNSGIWS